MKYRYKASKKMYFIKLNKNIINDFNKLLLNWNITKLASYAYYNWLINAKEYSILSFRINEYLFPWYFWISKKLKEEMLNDNNYNLDIKKQPKICKIFSNYYDRTFLEKWNIKNFYLLIKNNIYKKQLFKAEQS